MGITIHYSGRAKNWDSLTELLTQAQLFAAAHDWPFAIFDDPLGVMDWRDKDDPGLLEFDGPFRGIVLRPHPKCEPVRLSFSTSNEMSASTKTQFAPFRIHVQVTELLRRIEPFMDWLSVTDESGLWETGDVAAAQAQFEYLGRAIGALGDELRTRGLAVSDSGVDDPSTAAERLLDELNGWPEDDR